MSHTFFCKTCTRDHSTDLYAGMVGGDKYCTKHIAGARKRATERHAIARKQEIALEAQAKAKKPVRKMAINPIKGEARVEIERLLEVRRLEAECSMELNYF